jgi:hypothetical protein
VDSKYRRAVRAEHEPRVNAQQVLLDWYTSRGTSSDDANTPLIS